MHTISDLSIKTARQLGSLRRRTEELGARLNDLFAQRCRGLDIMCIPPATGRKREVQLECLVIMDRIKAAFDRNQIRYWLDFGSLLGAVRHRGFVPWDDDIDVSVPRDDFERARPVLKEAFAGTPYCAREYDEDHFQLRVKSADNKIGVDIFPVDAATDAVATADAAAALNARVLAARRQLTVDCAQSRAFERNFARVQARIAELTDAARGGPASPTSPYLFYAIDYPHGHTDLLLRRDDVFPLGEIAFEGRTFSCPHNPDAYLRAQYGDYLSFPRTIIHADDSTEENAEFLSLRRQIRNTIDMKIFEKTYDEKKLCYYYKLLGIRVWKRWRHAKAIQLLNRKIDDMNDCLDALSGLFGERAPSGNG